MKVRSLNGQTLRDAGFVAFECAALNHAANNCLQGETFVGVPSSGEIRYRESKTAFVVELKTDTEMILRYLNGTGTKEDKRLHVAISEGSGKGRPRKAETPAPKVETETPKVEETETPKEETPAPMGAKPAPVKVETAPTTENATQTALSALAQIEQSAYKRGKEETESKLQPQIDELIERLKVANNRPNGGGTTFVLTAPNGEKKETKVEHKVNPAFERCNRYFSKGKHLFMYGPAGSGKNVLAEDFAKAYNLEFYYINTVYTKYDFIGFVDANGKYVDTAFTRWLENPNGGILMIDEICTSMAEALNPINSLLSNGYITLADGRLLRVTENHRIIAADNTNGQGATENYNGRYVMEESTRDRFVFVPINYDKAIEKQIAGEKTDVLDFLREVRSICDETQIKLICGYRRLKDLVEFYDCPATETLEDCLLKGLEKDSVREIARRIKSTGKYQTALKQLAGEE